MTSMTVPDAQAYLGANRPQMVRLREYPETDSLSYDELVQLLCEKLYESTGNEVTINGDKFIVTISLEDVTDALMDDEDFIYIFLALRGAGGRWNQWSALIRALNQGMRFTTMQRITPAFNTAKTDLWSIRSNRARGVTLTKQMKKISLPETGINPEDAML